MLSIACTEEVAGPVGQVYVALHASNTVLQVDEPTSVLVTVVNLGRTVVTVNGNGCPAWYLVLSGDVAVAPGVEVCPLTDSNTQLPPGESMVTMYSWFGRTVSTIGSASVPLAPGGYSMEGRVRVNGRVLRSTSVAIRIVP